MRDLRRLSQIMLSLYFCIQLLSECSLSVNSFNGLTTYSTKTPPSSILLLNSDFSFLKSFPSRCIVSLNPAPKNLFPWGNASPSSISFGSKSTCARLKDSSSYMAAAKKLATETKFLLTYFVKFLVGIPWPRGRVTGRPSRLGAFSSAFSSDPYKVIYCSVTKVFRDMFFISIAFRLGSWKINFNNLDATLTI
jgi:hypothetical protein